LGRIKQRHPGQLETSGPVFRVLDFYKTQQQDLSATLRKNESLWAQSCIHADAEPQALRWKKQDRGNQSVGLEYLSKLD